MEFTEHVSTVTEMKLQNNTRNTPRRVLMFSVIAELPLKTRYLFSTPGTMNVDSISAEDIKKMLDIDCTIQVYKSSPGVAWENSASIIRIIDDYNNMCLIPLLLHIPYT